MANFKRPQRGRISIESTEGSQDSTSSYQIVAHLTLLFLLMLVTALLAIELTGMRAQYPRIVTSLIVLIAIALICLLLTYAIEGIAGLKKAIVPADAEHQKGTQTSAGQRTDHR